MDLCFDENQMSNNQINILTPLNQQPQHKEQQLTQNDNEFSFAFNKNTPNTNPSYTRTISIAPTYLYGEQILHPLISSTFTSGTYHNIDKYTHRPTKENQDGCSDVLLIDQKKIHQTQRNSTSAFLEQKVLDATLDSYDNHRLMNSPMGNKDEFGCDLDIPSDEYDKAFLAPTTLSHYGQKSLLTQLTSTGSDPYPKQPISIPLVATIATMPPSNQPHSPTPSFNLYQGRLPVTATTSMRSEGSFKVTHHNASLDSFNLNIPHQTVFGKEIRANIPTSTQPLPSSSLYLSGLNNEVFKQSINIQNQSPAEHGQYCNVPIVQDSAYLSPGSLPSERPLQAIPTQVTNQFSQSDKLYKGNAQSFVQNCLQQEQLHHISTTHEQERIYLLLKRQEYEQALELLNEHEYHFYHEQVQLEQMYGRLMLKQLELEHREERIKEELRMVVEVIQGTCQQLNEKDSSYSTLLSTKSELERHHNMVQIEVQSLQLINSQEKSHHLHTLSNLHEKINRFEQKIIPELETKLMSMTSDCQSISVALVQRNDEVINVKRELIENERAHVESMGKIKRGYHDQLAALEQSNFELTQQFFATKETLTETSTLLANYHIAIHNYQSVTVPDLEMNCRELGSKCSQLMKSCDGLEHQLLKLNQEHSALQSHYSIEIQSYQDQLAILKQRLRELECEEERGRIEISKMLKKQHETEIALKLLHTKSLQDMTTSHNNTLTELKAQYNFNESALVEKNAVLQEQIDAKSRDMETLQATHSTLLDKFSALQATHQFLNARFEQSKGEHSELAERFNLMSISYTKLLEQFDFSANEISTIKGQCDELQRESDLVTTVSHTELTNLRDKLDQMTSQTKKMEAEISSMISHKAKCEEEFNFRIANLNKKLEEERDKNRILTQSLVVEKDSLNDQSQQEKDDLTLRYNHHLDEKDAEITKCQLGYAILVAEHHQLNQLYNQCRQDFVQLTDQYQEQLEINTHLKRSDQSHSSQLGRMDLLEAQGAQIDKLPGLQLSNLEGKSHLVKTADNPKRGETVQKTNILHIDQVNENSTSPQQTYALCSPNYKDLENNPVPTRDDLVTLQLSAIKEEVKKAHAQQNATTQMELNFIQVVDPTPHSTHHFSNTLHELKSHNQKSPERTLELQEWQRRHDELSSLLQSEKEHSSTLHFQNQMTQMAHKNGLIQFNSREEQYKTEIQRLKEQILDSQRNKKEIEEEIPYSALATTPRITSDSDEYLDLLDIFHQLQQEYDVLVEDFERSRSLCTRQGEMLRYYNDTSCLPPPSPAAIPSKDIIGEAGLISIYESAIHPSPHPNPSSIDTKGINPDSCDQPIELLQQHQMVDELTQHLTQLRCDFDQLDRSYVQLQSTANECVVRYEQSQAQVQNEMNRNEKLTVALDLAQEESKRLRDQIVLIQEGSNSISVVTHQLHREEVWQSGEETSPMIDSAGNQSTLNISNGHPSRTNHDSIIRTLKRQLAIYIQLTNELSSIDSNLMYPTDNHKYVTGTNSDSARVIQPTFRPVDIDMNSIVKISIASTITHAENLRQIVLRYHEENQQIKQQHAALNDYLSVIQTNHKEVVQRINVEHLTNQKEQDQYHKSVLLSREHEHRVEIDKRTDEMKKNQSRFEVITKHIQQQYEFQYKECQSSRKALEVLQQQIEVLQQQLEQQHKQQLEQNQEVPPPLSLSQQEESRHTPPQINLISAQLNDLDMKCLNHDELQLYALSVNQLLSRTSSYHDILLNTIEVLTEQNESFKHSMGMVMAQFEKQKTTPSLSSLSSSSTPDPQKSGGWLEWLVGSPYSGNHNKDSPQSDVVMRYVVDEETNQLPTTPKKSLNGSAILYPTVLPSTSNGGIFDELRRDKQILLLEEQLLVQKTHLQNLHRSNTELRHHMVQLNQLKTSYQSVVTKLLTLMIYYHPNLIHFFQIISKHSAMTADGMNTDPPDDLLKQFLKVLINVSFRPDSTLNDMGQSDNDICDDQEHSGPSNDEDERGMNSDQHSPGPFTDDDVGPKSGWLSMLSGFWGDQSSRVSTTAPSTGHVQPLVDPQSIIIPHTNKLPLITWVEVTYLRSVLINYACYGHIEGLFAALQLLGVEIYNHQFHKRGLTHKNYFQLDPLKIQKVFSRTLPPPKCWMEDSFQYFYHKYENEMNKENIEPLIYGMYERVMEECLLAHPTTTIPASSAERKVTEVQILQGDIATRIDVGDVGSNL